MPNVVPSTHEYSCQFDSPCGQKNKVYLASDAHIYARNYARQFQTTPPMPTQRMLPPSSTLDTMAKAKHVGQYDGSPTSSVLAPPTHVGSRLQHDCAPWLSASSALISSPPPVAPLALPAHAPYDSILASSHALSSAPLTSLPPARIPSHPRTHTAPPPALFASLPGAHIPSLPCSASAQFVSPAPSVPTRAIVTSHREAPSQASLFSPIVCQPASDFPSRAEDTSHPDFKRPQDTGKDLDSPHPEDKLRRQFL